LQSIDKLDQPSLVARRQQHAFCSVSTSLSYVPSNAGDKAGLVVFQNEAAYYFAGLVKSDSGLVIQLEQGTKSGPVEIMKSAIDLPESNTLFLKIEARGKYYDFFYSTTPDEWTMLKENVDATLLSTVKAGGFVGACFGMYAFSAK
jgi:alpha-N-arabinofuranosidase